MVDLIAVVTYFGVLLGIGVFIENLVKKHKFPDTLFLLALGIILGPTIFLNPMITGSVSATLIDVNAMGVVPDCSKQ